MSRLFNLTSTKRKTAQKSESSEPKEGYFKPMPDKSKNETEYKAKVRFLPFFQTHQLTEEEIAQRDDDATEEERPTMYVTKHIHHINFPNDNPLQKFNGYYDCQQDLGNDCDLCDLYWALYDRREESQRFVDLVDKQNGPLKRWTRIAGYVYVIEDNNNPENVGKILLWEFGVKILKIIEELEEDEEINAFDPFNARPFKVKVTPQQGSRFMSYDLCSFTGNKGPISIWNEKKGAFVKLPAEYDDETDTYTPTKETELKLKNFIDKNIIANIDDFLSNEWNEEKGKKAKALINALLPSNSGGASVSDIGMGAVSEDVAAEEDLPFELPNAKKKGKDIESISADDFDDDDFDGEFTAESDIQEEKAKAKAKFFEKEELDEEEDDLPNPEYIKEDDEDDEDWDL